MAEMFGFYKIDAFEHKCWWSDKLGWGEKKDVTLFPRLMRIGDLLDHNYQNTVLMLNSNNRAETHIFGPNEQLAVGLAKAAKDNPVDPYRYSPEEIKRLMRESKEYDFFGFVNYIDRATEGTKVSLKALYPVRLVYPDLVEKSSYLAPYGWAYKAHTTSPDGKKDEFEFGLFKQWAYQGGPEVNPIFLDNYLTTKHNEGLARIGMVEYMTLVLAAQED